MGAAVIAGTAVAAAGQAYGAYSSYQQGKAAKAAAARNELLNKQAAEDALQQGEIDAGVQLSKAARLMSRQRVAMLAQGIDPASAGLASVTEGAALMGATDANTIRNNAARRAWGLRNQADTAAYEGELAQGRATQAVIGGTLGSAGTILGGMAKYKTLTSDGLETT